MFSAPEFKDHTYVQILCTGMPQIAVKVELYSKIVLYSAMRITGMFVEIFLNEIFLENL